MRDESRGNRHSQLMAQLSDDLTGLRDAWSRIALTLRDIQFELGADFDPIVLAEVDQVLARMTGRT